jgi:hypothetical protein
MLAVCLFMSIDGFSADVADMIQIAVRATCRTLVAITAGVCALRGFVNANVASADVTGVILIAVYAIAHLEGLGATSGPASEEMLSVFRGISS